MLIQTQKYLYDLHRTCFACPEQYDVYDENGNMVGYLRLRHGIFRGDCITDKQETVYESYPDGDGIFEDYERMHEITQALEAIHAHLVIKDKLCLKKRK